MVYETEEQQVEALKRWWQENGKAVILGVVVGIAGLFGWQSWSGYQKNQAEMGSTYLQQMLLQIEMDQYSEAEGIAKTLQAEYSDTPYAGLAGLLLAKSAMSQNQPDQAKAQLQWVAANAVQDDLDELARLRLARLHLHLGEYAEAEQLVAIAGPAFRPLFSELRGDIALAQGDRQAAYAAYQEAMKLGPANPSLLQMKIDDLGIDTEGMAS